MIWLSEVAPDTRAGRRVRAHGGGQQGRQSGTQPDSSQARYWRRQNNSHGHASCMADPKRSSPAVEQVFLAEA
jgi:hypothetical protein